MGGVSISQDLIFVKKQQQLAADVILKKIKGDLYMPLDGLQTKWCSIGIPVMMFESDGI